MAATNYEKIVTLAVVNYQSTWGNKRAGLDKIKKLAKRAADQDNNIIVFPEMALTGYESGGSKDMYRESAELVPGPATDELAELARKLDVYLVLGMPERDRANPDIIYNSSAVLGPEGFIGRYRKIGLSPPPFYDESLYFTPGRELPVFETRYGIIGVQICRDFWLYPEQTRILVLKGARLIVNPTASPKGADGGIFLTQQTRARATENMVYAGSANMVGKEVKLTYTGHSCIAGPNLPRMTTLLAEGGDTEEIVSATLNFERSRLFHDMFAIEREYPLEMMAAELRNAAAGHAAPAVVSKG